MTRFLGKTITHLVEVLKQVDNAALGLALRQTSRGRVKTSTLERSELRNGSDGGAADVEGSRGPDNTGSGSSEGANNGGAEHGGNFEFSARVKTM